MPICLRFLPNANGSMLAAASGMISMRPHRLAALILSFTCLAVPVRAQAPLPAGWPRRIELGMADAPGGAAAMKRTAPFALRYQCEKRGARGRAERGRVPLRVHPRWLVSHTDPEASHEWLLDHQTD